MAIVHLKYAGMLPRLLSMRDYTPFILVVDSIAQSSHLLLEQMYSNIFNVNVILISFETLQRHDRVDHFIEVGSKSLSELQSEALTKVDPRQANLIVIDTLAYIDVGDLRSFLSGFLDRAITLLATYHPSMIPTDPYYPSPLAILSFLAPTKMIITPFSSTEDSLELTDRFMLPRDSNDSTFKVEVEHKRKSGKAQTALFKVCLTDHSIEYIPKKASEVNEEDESFLKDLTTFNLTTSARQKLAKEQVDLPFLQAQEVGHGGANGGAIIYEYEKDDDYDEEDPYEDPF